MLPSALQTVDIPGVEIFEAGTHNGDRYTHGDLQDMVSAFDRLGFHPTVKADGSGSKNIGAPSLGIVERIYVAGDRLYADLKRVPRRVAEAITQKRIKKIAVEIYWQYKDEATGKIYPRALRGLTLVGGNFGKLDSIPAIESLFQNARASLAYSSGHELRSYQYQMEGSYMEANKPKEYSLTEGSRELAQKALNFAMENDLSFADAVKELLRRYAKENPQQVKGYR